MATSARAKADRRIDGAVRRISGTLKVGDTKGALNEACDTLRSEAAHLRSRRPADGALVDAELAGMLTEIAALLYDRKPARGTTPLQVFAASLEQAAGSEAHVA